MLVKLPPLERSDKTSYSVMPTACCNHQRQHRGAPKHLDNIKSPRVLQRALRCTGVFRVGFGSLLTPGYDGSCIRWAFELGLGQAARLWHKSAATHGFAR